MLHDILTRCWWTYDPADAAAWEIVYRAFNFAEGAAWCILGILVAVRFARHRKLRLEPAYAAAFVAFGLTDFQEAHALHTWLIVVKGLVLLALLLLRRHVIQHGYPQSKLF